MLNGDAHHSSVWEVEPRILPLLNCQRQMHPKRQGINRKQKNSGWATESGAKPAKSVARSWSSPGLTGHKLVRQNHGYGNAFD